MNEAGSIPSREILTPSSLARLARDLLEDGFPLLWIEGELSNVARPASGHLYFTLKDAGAQVRCAMFKPRSTWLRFRPADGMHVLARARVSLYEARGEFQLLVDSLEEAGDGVLRRAFEALKARLLAEGLFDASAKRPLPRWPRRIGVITSATGAAVRDVLSVLARRFPLLEVDVLPVPVQGKEAPPAIVAMLQAASRAARHDVLLLARGGGSLEDLMAFNDEAVARAIRASAVPVVSAIGHETDFTIADFAADLRAPTPSAAAELLVPDSNDLSRALDRQRGRLLHGLQRRIDVPSQRVDQLWARLQAQHPQARLARAVERLGTLRRRLLERGNAIIERRNARLAPLRARVDARHPAYRLAQLRQRTDALGDRLRIAMASGLDRRSARAAALARALHAVSPLATLERGFAVLVDASGAIVRSVGQVRSGDLLHARVADGHFDVVVKSGH